MLINVPLTLETMKKPNIQPWRGSQGPWCPKKFKKKHEKIANICKQKKYSNS